MGLNIVAQFIISFVLGTILGLEREINAKRTVNPKESPRAILGVRSFSLISILGTFVGVLYTHNPAFSVLIGANFILLSLIAYSIEAYHKYRVGITTELSMIFAFLIGISIALNFLPIQLLIALTIVVTLILSRKEDIKSLARDIRKREADAFISFAIIAIVILPFLPNHGYTLPEIPYLNGFVQTFPFFYNKVKTIQIINPFTLWMIVALMTGVNLFGYILERFIGRQKGWLLASFVGGFISSTATTQSLAEESKKHKRVNHLVTAAVCAYLGNYVIFPVLVAPINRLYLTKLLPVFSIIVITGFIIVFYNLRRKEKTGNVISLDQVHKTKDERIISIIPALRFAFLFLAIQMVSNIAYKFYGSSGFIFASAFAALTGIHAVLLNTAVLAGRTISFKVAVLTFLLVNAVNLTGKSTYGFLRGKRAFAVQYTIYIVIIICASLLSLLIPS